MASMPVVMVGHILAENYGTIAALIAIGIGNTLLCAVGFMMARLALKYRATTSDTVGRLGGGTLSKVFGVAMVVSMLGWFVVQCSVLVDFAQGYCPAAPQALLVLLIGASLILTTMGDIKRLFVFSEKLGPLILLSCLAMFMWSIVDAQIVQGSQDTIAFLPALSLVLATSLGVVIDVPTYYRIASSRKEAFLSLFIVIWLVTSVVQVLGVILVSQYSLTELIMSPFGIVLAVSGWLMNVNNLYSAVVSSQTLFKWGGFALRSIVFGGIGLMIVGLHAGESLATTIEAITLGISSMGGVMIACVVTERRSALALGCAWLIGVLIGGLGLTGSIALTGAAQIDAFSSAGVASTLFLIGVQLWQSQLSTNSN